MNIIFGTDLVEGIAQKHTLLELDTIRVISTGQLNTAYCVVEKIPVDELTRLEEMKNLHDAMLQDYKTRAWNDCEKKLQQLMHAWGTELDSFYEIMLARVTEFKIRDPGPSWTAVVDRE